MTLLCIPARLFFLPRFFEGSELCLLDGDDFEIKAWVDKKRHAQHSLRFADAEVADLEADDGEGEIVENAH